VTDVSVLELRAGSDLQVDLGVEVDEGQQGDATLDRDVVPVAAESDFRIRRWKLGREADDYRIPCPVEHYYTQRSGYRRLPRLGIYYREVRHCTNVHSYSYREFSWKKGNPL